ncbi:metal-dependent hydrolase [Halorussus sp. AFM4]|uniref:metal-dependent hydrolase n=1 Tax=Halorussus sp. AFM4 TaxID=3421651 RepID=UPI003EC07580
MHKDGHTGAALLLTAPLSYWLITYAGLPWGALLLVVASGVASLPDIDQKTPFLDHRGFTHTIWFCLAVSIIAGAGAYLVFLQGATLGSSLGIDSVRATSQAVPVSLVVFAGALLSLLSHLLADAITVGNGKMAVRPFWPMNYKKLRFGLVKSDSSLNAVLIAAGGLAQVGMFVAAVSP